MAELTYKDAGVDIAEGARAVDAIRNAVQSTYRDEVVGDIGGFGGLFSAVALKDMDEPLLVSGTDGVGTKLAIAQRFDRHDDVGIDLVAMCANDILTCGDLSGFCVGVVDRKKMIGPDLVREGDAIIGLASSGIHSNGFSLVRRAITNKASEEYMTRKRKELDGRSLLDALLEPTRIYVKSIQAVQKAGLPIHALAHITGGGITENLNRALPAGLDAHITLGSWDVPPVITFVTKAAEMSFSQALKTFNMGIGMAVICAEIFADDFMDALSGQGERVWRIGTVRKSEQGSKAAGQVIYE